VLKEASARLAENPLAETRHLKTLRPKQAAEPGVVCSRRGWSDGQYRPGRGEAWELAV